MIHMYITWVCMYIKHHDRFFSYFAPCIQCHEIKFFFFFLILIFFMLPFQSDYINKIREKIRTLFPKAPGNKNDFTYILIHLVSLSGVELFTLRNGYFMYFVHYKHTHTYIFTYLLMYMLLFIQI